MSLAQLINRPCVIQVRTESTTSIDKAGDPLKDVDDVETVCEVQPRSAIEPQNNDLSEEDYVGFFFPADHASLNSASAVWIPDLGTFEVVGKPPVWRNPRTRADQFVQANLRRTAGPDDSTGS